MNVFTRIYRGQTDFDFVATARRTLVVSAVLVVVSLLLLLVRPLNLSIDFSGGTVIVVENQADASIEEVRGAMAEIGLGGARVQLTGEGFIRVQTEALAPDAQDELILSAAVVAGVDVNEVTVSAVGPTFGAEVTRRALEALVIFLIVVTLFIAWRFEWKMAVAALVALFHDLAITGGIFALFQFTVSPATVIAILTIMGYSLYDTVVVFDKVDENVELSEDRHTYTEIVNTSMNQVLMRSINTSLTSLLPVGSLLLIGSFAFGAATLREFALALFIGITLGTYSSIFIAAPVLALWKEREEDWTRVRKRSERRGSGDETTAAATAVAAVAAGPAGATESPAEKQVLEVQETVHESTGATPRAPKKRKKRR
ncbi:MAG: protein translocase subunit SecF [Acidimicrobiia bacterium]|nr:MAG: protein translocase subunit SecF [Acidimicrobiia bacterium]